MSPGEAFSMVSPRKMIGSRSGLLGSSVLYSIVNAEAPLVKPQTTVSHGLGLIIDHVIILK